MNIFIKVKIRTGTQTDKKFESMNIFPTALENIRKYFGNYEKTVRH